MYMQQTHIHGEDFVGLFGIATDKYAILSDNFPETAVLGVPTLKTHIYGTHLVGMFCAGNSNALLVPYFIEDSEIKPIKEFLDELGVKIVKVRDNVTALGNVVVCNDHGAVISPKFSDNSVSVFECLGVEILKANIAGHDEVGACCTATNKGFLIHPDAEGSTEFFSGILGVDGMAGSVNMGFPYVKSGIVANSYGYITGRRTTGFELGRIDDALGFF